MESILSTFGIDWHLLLVNVINFGLLLVGLTYFLYKPILKMLGERRKQVAEGVEAAQASQMRLSEIESTRMTKLAEAGRQADDLVAAARKAGSDRERELVAAGEAAAVALRAEAEGEAKEMKEKAIAESRAEVAKLIVLGIEKSLIK